MRSEINKSLLMIAIPTTGELTMPMAQSMNGLVPPTNYSMVVRYLPNLEVGRAYNFLAQEAVNMGAKYMLTWEEDMVAPADGLRRLLYHMETKPELTYLGALYATKTMPPEPMVYTEWGMGPSYGWKMGELVPVKFTGMGFGLLRVADLARVEAEQYQERNPWTGQLMLVHNWFHTFTAATVTDTGVQKGFATQDAYFFSKCAEKGLQVVVDTSVVCPHYDRVKRTFFLPPEDNGTCVKPDPWNHTPRVANLGCGGEYNPFEVGVDLRDDPVVTYRCDIAQLPQDWTGQFDEVKAHQVLEHFDFGRTADVVAEWVRIVKPGGKLVIETPNLMWTAERITEGNLDLYIAGNLWGDQGHPFWMQESYGGWGKDGRWLADSFDHNHHKCGFTPKSLTSLMESCGLVNVEVESYSSQMRVVGKKPEVQDAESGTVCDT